MKVWIDDGICAPGEARIPVQDHGLLYGDGVFEGVRVYARRVFRLDAHLERLSVGARALGIELPGGVAHMRPVSSASPPSSPSSRASSDDADSTCAHRACGAPRPTCSTPA
jgi:hypothetical protein